jgi:hypothetical protein
MKKFWACSLAKITALPKFEALFAPCILVEKVWGCSLAKLCALPKFEALFCAEYFDKFNFRIYSTLLSKWHFASLTLAILSGLPKGPKVCGAFLRQVFR